MLGVPIYLSGQFSVRIYYEVTLEPKLSILTNFQETIPKYDLQCQYFINTVTQN